ncbi:MAG: FtsW/RodA/SpoVE family cell cycle protein, partial [Candidatus Pacearchaeota archaeon]|nr:FtsW/RodA/SpoVE family cell cycle protein [Candidatus Pacearchaeota archaeon]
MAKKSRKRPDPVLLGICLLILFVGLLILSSVSASFSYDRTGTPFYFLFHQMIFGFLPGLLLATGVFFLPTETLKRWSFPFLLGALVLTAMVFVPFIGGAVGGASRWIFLGPFSFQPTEALKPAFILYLASWLARRTDGKGGGMAQTLIPFTVIMGVIAFFLILQPDISTLGLIGIIAFFMYLSAPTPAWHTAFLAFSGIGFFFLLVKLAPYRMSRLAVFLDPQLDPLGKGYQIKQSLIGIGSGGLTGLGLGLSAQKFGFLPQPMSDSIFAVFAEEAGFLGAILLICLFLAFAWRGLYTAYRAQRTFE